MSENSSAVILVNASCAVGSLDWHGGTFTVDTPTQPSAYLAINGSPADSSAGSTYVYRSDTAYKNRYTVSFRISSINTNLSSSSGDPIIQHVSVMVGCESASPVCAYKVPVLTDSRYSALLYPSTSIKVSYVTHSRASTNPGAFFPASDSWTAQHSSAYQAILSGRNTEFMKADTLVIVTDSRTARSGYLLAGDRVCVPEVCASMASSDYKVTFSRPPILYCPPVPGNLVLLAKCTSGSTSTYKITQTLNVGDGTHSSPSADTVVYTPANSSCPAVRTTIGTPTGYNLWRPTLDPTTGHIPLRGGAYFLFPMCYSASHVVQRYGIRTLSAYSSYDKYYNRSFRELSGYHNGHYSEYRLDYGWDLTKLASLFLFSGSSALVYSETLPEIVLDHKKAEDNLHGICVTYPSAELNKLTTASTSSELVRLSANLIKWRTHISPYDKSNYSDALTSIIRVDNSETYDDILNSPTVIGAAVAVTDIATADAKAENLVITPPKYTPCLSEVDYAKSVYRSAATYFYDDSTSSEWLTERSSESVAGDTRFGMNIPTIATDTLSSISIYASSIDISAASAEQCAYPAPHGLTFRCGWGGFDYPDDYYSSGECNFHAAYTTPPDGVEAHPDLAQLGFNWGGGRIFVSSRHTTGFVSVTETPKNLNFELNLYIPDCLIGGASCITEYSNRENSCYRDHGEFTSANHYAYRKWYLVSNGSVISSSDMEIEYFHGCSVYWEVSNDKDTGNTTGSVSVHYTGGITRYHLRDAVSSSLERYSSSSFYSSDISADPGISSVLSHRALPDSAVSFTATYTKATGAELLSRATDDIYSLLASLGDVGVTIPTVDELLNPPAYVVSLPEPGYHTTLEASASDRLNSLLSVMSSSEHEWREQYSDLRHLDNKYFGVSTYPYSESSAYWEIGLRLEK